MKKKLWFKAKWYGWGWYPASIEGWLVIALFTLGIIRSSRLLPDQPFLFSLNLIILSLLLFAISYLKGEPPRWRWGKPRDDQSV